MKEFRCGRCNIYLGEMTQGKIKKGTLTLCTECYNAYKVYETLADEKYGDKSGKDFKGKYDMPEGFEALFGKFGK